MKIISLDSGKTRSMFVGTFSEKPDKSTFFIIGKTKYGMIRIPVNKKTYNIVQKKILCDHTKIPVTIEVELKVHETKKKNHVETNVLAGKVII